MTVGEIIALRRMDHNGEKYITGQQGARMQGATHAVLSYADNHGHMVIMPCRLSDRGEWLPLGEFLRTTVEGTMEVYRVPAGFELSDRMLAALRVAQRRYEARQR